MIGRTLYFVIPGDIETRTGGYGYDRQIIVGLRQRGWHVHLVSVAGGYPFPAADERADASRVLAKIPDRSTVVVDGLAFGALPAEMTRERERLRLVALVHHPLGLETGISHSESQRLLASEKVALTAAVGVVVTSHRTVSAVGALGVPPDRIAVVEPGTESALPAAGTGQGPLHMLCVASLVPRKGHDTLLDALVQLLDLDWQLTCVGSIERDAEYAATLVARCTMPPLGNRVALAGELAGAALDAAYDQADLFVLPTHYEGYGMVVAEAIARAIPVVSTRTGAIAELVGDAAGVLVPPADAGALATVLRAIITDRELLKRLRHGAELRRSSLPTWHAAAIVMEQALVRFAPA